MRRRREPTLPVRSLSSGSWPRTMSRSCSPAPRTRPASGRSSHDRPGCAPSCSASCSSPSPRARLRGRSREASACRSARWARPGNGARPTVEGLRGRMPARVSADRSAHLEGRRHSPSAAKAPEIAMSPSRPPKPAPVPSRDSAHPDGKRGSRRPRAACPRGPRPGSIAIGPRARPAHASPQSPRERRGPSTSPIFRRCRSRCGVPPSAWSAARQIAARDATAPAAAFGRMRLVTALPAFASGVAGLGVRRAAEALRRCALEGGFPGGWNWSGRRGIVPGSCGAASWTRTTAAWFRPPSPSRAPISAPGAFSRGRAASSGR